MTTHTSATVARKTHKTLAFLQDMHRTCTLDTRGNNGNKNNFRLLSKTFLKGETQLDRI